MAYTHHSPISSKPTGQPFHDLKGYPHQYQQYRPSPSPSPRPSPQPSPQLYAYQQVHRPPPSPQYNHTFSFPQSSPQPPIQQSNYPYPDPQSTFSLPQGYTPPTHIPPSLQVRVKTPAPLEQTTASPRPHYAYLPQQNVITSPSTPSPPRATSPSRPLPPPQRSRSGSVPPISRIQLPTSSFTENTLYRQPSSISVSPTRTPNVLPPSPAPLVSSQSPVQAPAHQHSYSADSVSPRRPASSFGYPIPLQNHGQMLPHTLNSNQVPGQTSIQLPPRRSESPNKGRPLPTPTSRTPSPTKSIHPPIVSRSLTDDTTHRQLQERQPQQLPPLATRSTTQVNLPPSNVQSNAGPGSFQRPASSMSATNMSSHVKEIALPPPTIPGQPFVPYWKRNLQGGPRAHGIQRRGTIAEGSSTNWAPNDTPVVNSNSFSSLNCTTSPTKALFRQEVEPEASTTQKPITSPELGGKGMPRPQLGPQTRTNDTTQQRAPPPTISSFSQPPSTSSPHKRRGAEIAQSNMGPGPGVRPNPVVQPHPLDPINHNRSGTVPAPTSGSGFAGSPTVPSKSKPVRSQSYDPKSFTRREDPDGSTTRQQRALPSPNKPSGEDKVGYPPARIASPQYGILDMPRSRFSQRVEAKTEALNGFRNRGASPARSESPTKDISPFPRSESPTRNPSPTRSQGLPRPPRGTSNSHSADDFPFPPALKRSSITPQSVTLQMATMGIGDRGSRGPPLDQHQVQRPSSPHRSQQERIQQNGITKSESGWPSNLPRLPRTPATSQHPNSAVNGTHGAAPTFVSSNHSNPSSLDRNPVRQNDHQPDPSSPRFSPREGERRSAVGLDLDDAPPPSLRRSPSPASSIASSNFSSFSAAMESYRNGVHGSQFSATSGDSHQRMEGVPSSEPEKTSNVHSYSQPQPLSRARQQTAPSQRQVLPQPGPRPNQQRDFSPSKHPPVLQQSPPQNQRRQPAPPTIPPMNVDPAPPRSKPRSPTVPTIRNPQAQSPQRPKISFPVDPDLDSGDNMNGPKIAVSFADGSGSGPKICVSGTDDVPSISINVGDTDENHGNGSTIDGNPGGPSVTVNGEKKSVAELPTIRRDGGLSCGGCGGMIVGRVVSAMGVKWHPRCFRCCACNELLENLSSYEKDGRSFCHLDYHEVGLHWGCLSFVWSG